MKKTDIDANHIWHPYAPAVNAPPVQPAVRSAGTRILTGDGVPLIDGISSWWCASFGHRPAHVIEAVRRQAEQMPHIMFAGFTHEPAVRLTEKLRGLMPAGLEHYFYADSGSTAVECALKMALQYQRAAGHPERKKIAALRGGYHGDTMGAMSVSDPGGMHEIFHDILPHQVFLDRPECPFDAEWDDSSGSVIRHQIDRHAHELAAVIAEPVFQGANAMRFYHPEYLKVLRAACDAHGILLIFDEIATGFGRTGKLFASHYAGIEPDIMCIGKALTAGCMSLACAAASERIAAAIPALLHGPTFMANPLACAAASAALDLLNETDWRTHTARIERTLKQGLAAYRGMRNVRGVRVLGAVGVLEVEHIPDPETVRKTALETGVWLRPFDHFVYTMPPFITPEDELEQIISAMGRLVDV